MSLSKKYFAFGCFNDTACAMSIILGYLSNLQVNLDVISAKPFNGLQNIVDHMNTYMTLNLISTSILWLQNVMLRLIANLAMPILLPVGLFFRLFFPTRRLGAILIGMGVAFYIIFPIIMLMASSPSESLPEMPFKQFNDRYSFVPMTDLNRGEELLTTITEISMTQTDEDLVSQATTELKKSEVLINTILFYNVISIVLALVTSSIFAWELYKLLGSPMIANFYYV